MAARLTDKQKKKIIADYAVLGSYNAVAKLHGISKDTVKRTVQNCGDFAKKAQQKKEQNTADILAYMESKRSIVCEILGKGLEALNSPEKLKEATPAQITTAMGTLIDKWTAIGGGPKDTAEEDGLSRSLKEMAEELENDE
ncbi:MAG: helix-turn-helix domain-containing protein [Oscillospiraceae bacterium]